MPLATVTGLTSYRYWDADGTKLSAGMGATVEVLDEEQFARGVDEGWITPLPESEASSEKPKKPAKPKKSRKNKKTEAAPEDADQAADGEPVASEGVGESASQATEPETSKA